MTVNDLHNDTHTRIESAEGCFISQKEASRPQKCREVYRLSIDNARKQRCADAPLQFPAFQDDQFLRWVSLFKFLTVSRALSIPIISIYKQEERGFIAV